MKQLLFLLLFPCLALAQYQGNGNQKITLGEQTTADGLVWRGRTSDTSNLMTNKIDTSAYLVLDTITEAIWLYRASTTPKWNRVVDSLNNLQGQLSLTTKVTGVLPVANGGTNRTTMPAGYILHGDGTSVDTSSQLFWDRTNRRLLFNTLTTQTGEIVMNASANTHVNSFVQIFADNNVVKGYNGYCGQNGHLLNEAVPGDMIFRSNLGRYLFGTFQSGASDAFTALCIANNRNIGIGTVSPQSGYKLHVVDSVYVGGRVSAAGYTTRSDYNLKDEIQTLNYGLNEVIQMQPVKYTYKSNGEQQLGFIAQDIGTLIPESVHFDEFMGVDYQSLIPILTKAIQEQQALIKALEQRILNLENK